MLDEIINYVQSLQRQIEVSMHSFTPNWIWKTFCRLLQNPNLSIISHGSEYHNVSKHCKCFTRILNVLTWVVLQFLSMKLAAVDPRHDINIDNLLNKEVQNWFKKLLICSTSQDLSQRSYVPCQISWASCFEDTKLDSPVFDSSLKRLDRLKQL